MDNTNAKRDSTILIRVTQQEKDQISKNAEAYGGAVSEFAREQLLHPDSNSTSGAQMQAIARELCRLSEDIRKIDNPELRHNLEERIKAIWPYIK